MQAARHDFERVVSPEAVPIELDVAGLGSRAISLLIDMLIQVGCVFALTVVMAGLQLGEIAGIVIMSIALFFIFWGYFFVFEGLWHGRTPGKRAQRLRVVRVDGHPMSTAQMFVRNLLRIVDFLPAYYAIGAISIVVTKRSQRLGDLAAGTLVIREGKPFTPTPVVFPPPPPVGALAPPPSVDVSGMTEAHYQLVRAYFERRGELDPTARSHLAGQIAAAVRPVVRTALVLSDEGLLEAAATAYRRRFSPG